MSDMSVQNPQMLAVINNVLAGETAQPVKPKSDVKREPDQISEARKKKVEELLEDVRKSKKHWEKRFKKMRWEMKFAKGRNHWPNQREDDDRYLINIVQRHIRQRVSSVYAKNPTALVKRCEKLEAVVWDGTPKMYLEAKQRLEMAMALPQPGMPPAPPPMPLDEQIVAEVEQIAEKRKMITRIGDSARLALHYFMREQEPSFKRGMKRVVRRAKTVGVGYVRLNFKRLMGKKPETEQGLIDAQARLEKLQALRADQTDEKLQETDAEIETLKQMTESLAKEEAILLREGIEFDFPQPTRVIPHWECRQLDGFLGAPFVAIEHLISPQRVKEVYKVDLGTNFKPFEENAEGVIRPVGGDDGCKKGKALVYQIYHRAEGLEYVVVDGYPDYLVEPEDPIVDIERFYPIYAYTTNELEDEDDPFPPSDVELLKHVQREYNRTGEARRQHRYANRPVYLTKRGTFATAENGESDLNAIANALPHGIVEVDALPDSGDPSKIIAALPKVGMDPNMYETETLFNDALRSVGSQESEFGGVSNETATGVAVADGAKMSSVQDDIDELDMLLSALFRDATKVMLREMSPDTIKKIAGPGAVWPEYQSRQEIAEELYLDIQAGSSGRPNRAQEIANFERLSPLLTQLPGIAPEWLAKKAVQLVDPGVDFSEAVTDGIPSIVQQNSMTQPGTGDPATDPNAQGPQGADNAPAAPLPGGLPQPGFPGQQQVVNYDEGGNRIA